MELKKKLSLEKYQQLNLDIAVKVLSAFVTRQDPEYFSQATRRERFCFVSKLLAKTMMDELGFYASANDPMGSSRQDANEGGRRTEEVNTGEEERHRSEEETSVHRVQGAKAASSAPHNFDRPITHLDLEAFSKMKDQETSETEDEQTPVLPKKR